LLSIDDIAPTAEVIGDQSMRSVDAIHLATAHEIRPELTAFVCYDKRLRDSAEPLGITSVTASSATTAWAVGAWGGGVQQTLADQCC
jgi:hypothetical protein